LAPCAKFQNFLGTIQLPPRGVRAKGILWFKESERRQCSTCGKRCSIDEQRLACVSAKNQFVLIGKTSTTPKLREQLRALVFSRTPARDFRADSKPPYLPCSCVPRILGLGRANEESPVRVQSPQGMTTPAGQLSRSLLIGPGSKASALEILVLSQGKTRFGPVFSPLFHPIAGADRSLPPLPTPSFLSPSWPATRPGKACRRPGAESDPGRTLPPPLHRGAALQRASASACWGLDPLLLAGQGFGASAPSSASNAYCSMPPAGAALAFLFAVTGGQLPLAELVAALGCLVCSFLLDPCAAAARPAPRPPPSTGWLVMGSVAVPTAICCMAMKASGANSWWLGCFSWPNPWCVGVSYGACASSGTVWTLRLAGPAQPSPWRVLALARRGPLRGRRCR